MSPPPHAPSPQAPYGYKVRSHTVHCTVYSTQLEQFWRISLYLTDDAIAKLYVT